MKESKSQIILSQYFRESRIHCYYELKVATGNSFQFSSIEEHQFDGLKATSKNGLAWKLSDEDRRKKPCDGFCSPPLPSYLIIQYDKTLYLIDIWEIVKLKNKGDVSIGLEKAKEIAVKVNHI